MMETKEVNSLGGMLSQDINKHGEITEEGIKIKGVGGEVNLKFKQEVNSDWMIKNEFIQLISGRDKKWGEASELLTNYIKSWMHIYTTKDDNKSEVWIYDQGIYIPNGKCRIKEFLRNLLGSFYSQYIYGLVINKVEPDTFVESNEFFSCKYPNEICLENGILNVETLELQPYTHKKIFFNKMPVKFNLKAQCPNIEKFLKDVLSNEEDIRVIEEYLGFALMDTYVYEKSLMMHGQGRNGKGKCIELFKRLFGMNNCSAIPLTSLKSDDFAVSELFGKRLNLAGDIGNQDLKDTSMFKSLTGRDLVSGKRKFMNNIPFMNNAKFIFACNELPMVYDTTRGFWDRWLLLDFPYTFVTQEEYDQTINKDFLKIKDDFIIDKISNEEELSGLLNLALVGLQRLKDHKKFSITKGSEEIKQMWIRRSNSFMAFAMDCLMESYESKIPKRYLRKKYTDYCKEHKIKTKTDYVIKKVIQEEFGGSETRILTEVEGQIWFWEGIKLKN